VSSGRTGILGGTFDPVHLGHLAVARQSRDHLGLEGVLLMPSSQPPHRPEPAAGAEERLEMVRLATEGLPGLAADDAEVRRGGVSYTVDTLRQLRRERPERELVLLLGSDAAGDFGTWHEAPAIRELAAIAVFNRSGSPALDPGFLAAAGLPSDAAVFEVESPPVSATEIRRRLASGEDVEGMLPASVLGYIRERGLYGAGQ
jgi:nicotinate-nucleotide adenylyltransferase